MPRNDTLSGGDGADVFLFDEAGAGSVDQVTDFSSGVDMIELKASYFTGLSAGALDGAAFVVGNAAADADDRIVYDQTTGTIFYDADGVGAVLAQQIAVLQGSPTLAATDFLIA